LNSYNNYTKFTLLDKLSLGCYLIIALTERESLYSNSRYNSIMKENSVDFAKKLNLPAAIGISEENPDEENNDSKRTSADRLRSPGT
jgi:hypothetical protein